MCDHGCEAMVRIACERGGKVTEFYVISDLVRQIVRFPFRRSYRKSSFAQKYQQNHLITCNNEEI